MEPSKVMHSHGIVCKTLAFPINPSDVNQIQGVYTSPVHKKEVDGFVPGIEGVFKVVAVGKEVTEVKLHDIVLPKVPNLGTWRQELVCDAKDVFTIPEMPIVMASVLTVNICTAYRLIHDFHKKGGVVVQNGGTSQVALYVSQLCKAYNIPCVSVVRRSDKNVAAVAEIEKWNVCFYEDEMRDENVVEIIKKMGRIQLLLNCVGGKRCVLCYIVLPLIICK